MDSVPENVDFNTLEEDILKYWDEIDAFQTSVKTSEQENRPLYSFYDGPPFATGLPHYGHILAGTIKDIVTRYAHQTGHHVVRRFGWDCHGLPIEFQIDQEIGIKSREDVLKMGIPTYNQHCRGIVMRFSKEWEVSVKRLGRWIDFKNDYKTMDTNYMESVWWVFKTLFDKDLVYRGFKVMPYSPGCTTPLSNFESNSNYKEVSDPSVVVSFPLEEDPSTSLLIWTTTPWTLPSNLAICVHPKFEYVQVEDKAKKQNFILSKKRLVQLYKKPDEYVIKKEMKGEELVGKKYAPLFHYFERFRENGAFRVVSDEYVTEDSGTGLVHQAPAFGEDDYRVCMHNGIIKKGGDLPCPIDADCCFTNEVPEHFKVFVKDADNSLKQRLKEMGRLIQSGSIKHSYPYCWRSETPLIYRAVPCWFIAVEKIKPQLLANSENSYWIPEHVKEGRFHNWLTDARDWAVSRNRFWGTPLPIWISDDGEERVCVGSIEELYQLTGVRVNDLHRETVDGLTIPSKRGEGFGVLRRIEEVFDCWFESGSMPYAQVHYPFENKEVFLRSFPADFIAEGLDQTRGWFYTLLVLSTALFDKPAFKNVIVNGLVLASDGKKMSKRLKNYPDPHLIVQRYGADALRMYLINSPVVRAEPLKFKEEGVKALLKDVFLPWFNAFRFLNQNIKRYEKDNASTPFCPDFQVCLSSQNLMDKWILAATQSLISFVRDEMKAYRLYTVIPRLVQFIEQLTNWYVRLNRPRLKGAEVDPNTHKEHARLCSLNTLYEVLMSTCRVMAPFTPFFAEYLYLRLSQILPEAQRQKSVHFTMFPEPRTELLNAEIEKAVSAMQTVIELGRAARDRRKLPLKFPLKYMMIVTPDEKTLHDLKKLERYILDELNLSEFRESADEESYVLCKLKPDMKVLGPKFGKQVKQICTEIENLPSDKVKDFMKSQTLTIQGITVDTGLNVSRQFKGDAEKFEASFDEALGFLVILNLEVDQEQRERAFTREIVNRIQKLRKKGGLQPTDSILIEWKTEEKEVKDIIVKYHELIEKTISNPVHEHGSHSLPTNQLVIQEEVEISETKISLHLYRR